MERSIQRLMDGKQNKSQQLKEEQIYKENKELLKNNENIAIKQDNLTVESIKSDSQLHLDKIEDQPTEVPNTNPCIYCLNRSSLKDSLKKHIIKWHKEKKKKISLKNMLMKHIEVHKVRN